MHVRYLCLYECSNISLVNLHAIELFYHQMHLLDVILIFSRFNYRSTHYMVKHGFYNFLNWFDERAWYPLGRIVGGTVRIFLDKVLCAFMAYCGYGLVYLFVVPV